MLLVAWLWLIRAFGCVDFACLLWVWLWFGGWLFGRRVVLPSGGLSALVWVVILVILRVFLFGRAAAVLSVTLLVGLL